MNKQNKTSEHEDPKLSLLRGTSVVASLTVISRILGFLRDALVARLFGASVFADAFFVAFRIPNLLRSLVAEGALTSAFVPVFNDELRKNRHDASRALTSIAVALAGVCCVLTVSGMVFSRELITLFAPGFVHDEGQLQLASGMLRVMLPLIVCVSLVALINGALNSVGVFGSGAWAQIVMNCALILGALLAAFFNASTAAYLLAGSVVVGAVLQVIVQLPALNKAGFAVWTGGAFSWPPIVAVAKLLPPAIIGATVYQFQIFLLTVMATLCGSGAVSWMFYADRIVQLPVGIYTIALSSVLLAVLSRARAQADTETFARELNKALSLSLFLLMPLSAGLALYAEPLAQLLFVRGAFMPSDAHQTASIVAVSSLGLVPISLHSIFARVFIAHKDTTTTTAVGMMTLMITLVVGLSLVGPIGVQHAEVAGWLLSVQEVVPPIAALGVVGLAWASVFASAVSCSVLGLLLVFRFKISLIPLLPACTRSAFATSIFVAAGLLLRPNVGWVLSGAIASGFWLLCHYLLGASELSYLKNVLKRAR